MLCSLVNKWKVSILSGDSQMKDEIYEAALGEEAKLQEVRVVCVLT